MRNFIILFLFLLAMPVVVSAQQLGLFDQNLMNPFLLNPAAAGLDKKIDLCLGYRSQYNGIPNAPSSYFFTANSLIGQRGAKNYSNLSLRISQPDKYKKISSVRDTKFKQAVGGSVVFDRYGPFTKSIENIAYAVRTKMKDKYNLSFGLSLGMLDVRFSQDDIILIDPDDPTYQNFLAYNNSMFYLDANAGLFLYTEKMSLGYAARQLLGNAVSFGGTAMNADLNVHHLLSGSLKIQKGEKMAFVPGFMLRYMSNVPLSYDILLRGVFMEDYWGGLLYRSDQSVAILLGATYNIYRIGYSFDYNVGGLGKVTHGSHEIQLGMLF